MERLSAGAKMLLKHFKDKRLGQGEFEHPDEMRKLFAIPQECEDAQDELAKSGLLDLGPVKSKPDPDNIRSAALTREAVRALQAF
jgi:hypothetical protein